VQVETQPLRPFGREESLLEKKGILSKCHVTMAEAFSLRNHQHMKRHTITGMLRRE
jgi:hypothetical protein